MYNDGDPKLRVATAGSMEEDKHPLCSWMTWGHVKLTAFVFLGDWSCTFAGAVVQVGAQKPGCSSFLEQLTALRACTLQLPELSLAELASLMSPGCWR